jgi:hypothetical protein
VAENESKWLLVLLKTDGNKGSASVMCQAIDQDPMFPDKVILRGILGFFWPTGRHHLQVQAWSVPKSVVLNWMLGALRPGMPVTAATLAGESKSIPLLPGIDPHMSLATPAEIDTLFQQANPEPPADPKPPANPEPPKAPSGRKARGGRK